MKDTDTPGTLNTHLFAPCALLVELIATCSPPEGGIVDGLVSIIVALFLIIGFFFLMFYASGKIPRHLGGKASPSVGT